MHFVGPEAVATSAFVVAAEDEAMHDAPELQKLQM